MELRFFGNSQDLEMDWYEAKTSVNGRDVQVVLSLDESEDDAFPSEAYFTQCGATLEQFESISEKLLTQIQEEGRTATDNTSDVYFYIDYLIRVLDEDEWLQIIPRKNSVKKSLYQQAIDALHLKQAVVYPDNTIVWDYTASAKLVDNLIAVVTDIDGNFLSLSIES